MAKLEIQIQTSEMLKPSTPTLNHLRSLNLSMFDQPDASNYAPILFHYLPSNEQNNTAERCDKLKKSLADTLVNFYPLAGRFSRNDLTIHCNDEGAEYVETRVNANLAQFLHQLGPKIELLDHLIPWCNSFPPESTHLPPLLAVQVNIFNCGGLVIGIQISHIITDGFTLGTFMTEWARVSRTGTATKDCSYGHLPSLFPSRVVPLAHHDFSSLPSSDIVGPKIVTRRFVFDAQAIANLKHRINSSAPFTKPNRVMIVLSLIWNVLVGISSAKRGHSRDSCLIIPINVRAKSKLPSLQHALGNCTLISIPTLEANNRQELHDFANLVGSTLRETLISIGKANIDDIASMVADQSRELVNAFGQKDEKDIYLSSSWCKFPWYEVDFGWGKPFWVSSACRLLEVIILVDTKEGDGIEAWVSLKEDDIIEFERNIQMVLPRINHISSQKITPISRL
ncbi:putative salutaridinol 7-O-acetyltransferase-like [Capsicum annuum]|nr:putative salutaridinol 7-O-acetyltransferase-like [Capsicum annuum]